VKILHAPTLLLLISAGCIYGAPSARSLAADDECRRVCADAHQGCVSGGVARRWGLPGVTYDLCAREQESCLESCRNGGGPVANVAADAGVLSPGVVWDEAASKLRCPLQTSWLAVPDGWRASVKTVSATEAQLRTDDAVVSIQSAQGEPPSPLEAWALLHAQLSPLSDAPTLSLSDGADWTFEYAVTDGGAAGAFRTRQKTVRRAGGYCRVIAVERASAISRATSLLDGFH
jgi:hypothetical protein